MGAIVQLGEHMAVREALGLLCSTALSKSIEISVSMYFCAHAHAFVSFDMQLHELAKQSTGR